MSQRQRKLARNAKLRAHHANLHGTPYADPFATVVNTLGADIPVTGVLKAPVPAFPAPAVKVAEVPIKATVGPFEPLGSVKVDGTDTLVHPDTVAAIEADVANDPIVQAAIEHVTEHVTRWNNELHVTFRDDNGIVHLPLGTLNRTQLRRACSYHGIPYSQLRTDGMKVALTNKLQPVG